MSYWNDTVTEALLPFGIVLTDEQLEAVVESIEVSHSNYGMAHGHDSIPNPLEAEVRRKDEQRVREIDDLEKRHKQIVADLEYEIRALRRRIRELERDD